MVDLSEGDTDPNAPLIGPAGYFYVDFQMTSDDTRRTGYAEFSNLTYSPDGKKIEFMAWGSALSLHRDRITDNFTTQDYGSHVSVQALDLTAMPQESWLPDMDFPNSLVTVIDNDGRSINLAIHESNLAFNLAHMAQATINVFSNGDHALSRDFTAAMTYKRYDEEISAHMQFINTGDTVTGYVDLTPNDSSDGYQIAFNFQLLNTNQEIARFGMK